MKLRLYPVLVLFSFLFLFTNPLKSQDQNDCVEVSVFLQTGLWGQEIGFTLYDDNGTLVFDLNAAVELGNNGDLTDNTSYEFELCLQPGCYSLQAFDDWGDGWNGAFVNIGYEGFMGELYTLEAGSFGQSSFGIETEGCEIEIPGCTDPNAINYDWQATVDDGSCEYFEEIEGCTDPDASNWNPQANVDDGSCIYPEPCEGAEATLYICTFGNGEQVELQILDSEGNEVIFVSELQGVAIEYFDICLDANECYTVNMINNQATGWYGGYYWINSGNIQVSTGELDDDLNFESNTFSISGEACPSQGCTDIDALNYNETADIDDGSCIYPAMCDDTPVLVDYTPGQFASEVSWQIIDSEGNQIFTFEGNDTYEAFSEELCLEDGCYILTMLDSFGDGWNGAVLTLSFVGEQESLSFTLQSGNNGVETFVVGDSDCSNVILGCTDAQAINYTPDASLDDGSCIYPIPGCTDPAASNYNWQATVDDGSCEYEFFGCTDEEALNYNPQATIDDGTCVYSVENDLCADALPLIEGMQLINNSGAFENENIWGECWGLGNGEGEQSSIWFSFTTPEEPASIHIEAMPDGSNTLTDTQFGLFEECGGEMIACDGNSGSGWLSAFSFACDELEPNTTYLLMVDGFMGDAGTCFLSYEVNPGCDEIEGCTDSEAINYDPNATIDDGSCQYTNLCNGGGLLYTLCYSNYDSAGIYIEPLNPNIPVSLEVFSGELEQGFDFFTVYSGQDNSGAPLVGPLSGNLEGVFVQSLPGEGLYVEIIADFIISCADGDLPPVVLNIGCGNIAEIAGCTDPEASNYNPNATIEDGSCIYNIAGCTDPAAINYMLEATIDDGSCIYEEECEGATSALVVVATENWGTEISWILSLDGNPILSGEGYQDFEAQSIPACLEDGCYTLELFDSFGDGWNGGLISIVTDDEVLAVSDFQTGSFQSITFGVNTDECESNEISGCTDPEAINYNPNATVDDGSCDYEFECQFNEVIVNIETGNIDGFVSYGIGYNYNEYFVSGSVLVPNQSYGFEACIPDGCFSLFFENNESVDWEGSSVSIFFDGVEIASLSPTNDENLISVEFGINSEDCGEVAGCTDETAVNYNPEATVNDGSCVYAECELNTVLLLIETQSFGNEVSWELENEEGVVVANGSNYASFTTYEEILCLGDGCYTMNMYDSFGDGWNGAYYLILGDGLLYGEGSMLFGSYEADLIGINSDCEVAGCTDPQATNFDPDATIDDGTCLYFEWLSYGDEINQANKQDLNLIFFPNPIEDLVQLQIYNADSKSSVELDIYDSVGRLVKSRQFNNQHSYYNEVLETEYLESGVYFFTIRNGERLKTTKLIKK